MFCAFLLISLTGLGAVLYERDAILASFRTIDSGSLFGPFDPDGGYQALVRSLGQAAIVFGLGVFLVLVARKRPELAGSAAVIIMTADLAVANARYVLTVPQSLLESKPEVLKIIEAAERDDPAQGPYRIHRMPIWSPLGWRSTRSKDRVFELVTWEHDTMQPKYGINHGVEYTYTLGVAELYDYDWYFNGFPRIVRDPEIAENLGVELGKEIVYYPRRAFDMWNTRYVIVPYWHGGWRDEYRGFAAFISDSKRIYPDADQFRVPKGGVELEKNWIETSDFRILRNLNEFPRAWVVHNARMTLPVSGLSRARAARLFRKFSTRATGSGTMRHNGFTTRAALLGSRMKTCPHFGPTCRARRRRRPRP